MFDNWMFRPASLGVRIASALFGAALGLALVAAFPAHAKGFYVAGQGGMNWHNLDYNDGWLTVDGNAGYLIGAQLGTTIDSVPGLRVEGDLSFRHNGADVAICHNLFGAEDEVWALMGNVAYDIPVHVGPVQPFIFAGVGYASRTATVKDIGLELSNAGLAYQLGGGLNVAIAQKITARLAYTHFNGPDVSYAGINPEGSSHNSVTAALVFAFD